MYDGKMDPADSLQVSMTPSSCLESKDSCSCSLKVYWTATITGAIGAVGGNIYNIQQQLQSKDSCLTRLRHIGLIVTTAPRTGDDNNWDNHNSYCGW